MSDESGYQPEPKGFATSAIRDFQNPNNWSSLAVIPPMVSSTTFMQSGPGKFEKYAYSRAGNPNRDILEKCLASLDNGQYGLCWSSGLGAIAAVASIFKAGDHIVSGDDIYGGTNRLFSKVCSKFGLEVTFTKEDEIEKSIKPNTKLIFVESLTNPGMQVADIKAISAIAKKRNIVFAVDNSFMSPYFLRPLDLGADIVIHSVSKYINGHSDVIMGVTVTNNKQFYDELKLIQATMGIVPAPFDCYQVTRGIKTLAIRMKRHMTSSLEVAEFLQCHPKVDRVLHPGLKSHPQHELFKKQASGCSGVLSFYIKSGDLPESERFFKALKIFTLGLSLGGFESLASLPSLMSHRSVSKDLKQKLGITDNLIRLSIGLEDVEDLICDLNQALEKI